jgi:hypothetical protein
MPENTTERTLEPDEQVTYRFSGGIETVETSDPAATRLTVDGEVRDPREFGPMTYHVAPDGDDANTGYRDSPWRTLAHAKTRLGPGDTLMIESGTYTPDDPLRMPDGTGDADGSGRITIVGDPSDPASVVIDAANVRGHDGSGSGYQWADGLVLGRHTDLTGIRVTNAPNQGIATYDDVTVRRCVSDGNTGNGFHTAADGVTIVHCTAYGNGGVGYKATGTENALADCIAASNDGGPTDLASDVTTTNSTWTFGIDSPGFVSTDPASEGYLRLTQGSPCIGAGTDGADLGAYDYSGSDGGSGSGGTDGDSDDSEGGDAGEDDNMTDDTEHELILSSSDGGADYEFQIEEGGEITDADDTVSDDGLRATGTVWENYTDYVIFTGIPKSLTGDPSLTAELDGETVDPEDVGEIIDGGSDGAGETTYSQSELDAAVEEARSEGYDTGYDQGYSDGTADGEAIGEVTGWNDALSAVREGLPAERSTDSSE